MSDRTDTDRQTVMAILEKEMPGYELIPDRSPDEYPPDPPDLADCCSIETLQQRYGRRAGSKRDASPSPEPASPGTPVVQVYRVKPRHPAAQDVRPTTVIVSLTEGKIIGVSA